MTEKQAKLLAYPFTADEIEWRILLTAKDKSKGQVAAYIDSRAIQKRLDDVLGRENWKNHFITMPGNSNSTTAHICEISIYYPDRQEWITKSDGAGSTDIEPCPTPSSGRLPYGISADICTSCRAFGWR